MSQIVIKLPPIEKPEPAVAAPVAPVAPAAPVPPQQPVQSSGWIQTALIVAAVLVGAFLIRGGDGSDDGGDVNPDPPAPIVSVEKVVADADKQRSLNDALAMERLAQLIDEGKIETQQAFLENSQAFTKAARVEAFKPIDQMDQQMIPQHTTEQPKWTAQQKRFMAEYLRKQAKGFREKAK